MDLQSSNAAPLITRPCCFLKDFCVKNFQRRVFVIHKTCLTAFVSDIFWLLFQGRDNHWGFCGKGIELRPSELSRHVPNTR